MEKFVTFKETQKSAIYEEMLPQLRSILHGEKNPIANLSNTASVIKMAFPDTVSWVGFYLLHDKELVLGPFQGKPACVRIQIGRGVCGTSAETLKTLIVPDVRKFPDHIFCDPSSLSEIVLPIIDSGKLRGVLDLDSNLFSTFDDVDGKYLSVVVGELLKSIESWP